MSAKLICPVCGNSFDGCYSCEKHELTSWKTICDTENHFNIFIILHKYNVTKKITKEKAKELLLKCNLTGYENFQKNIAESIKNILEEEKPVIEPAIIEETIEQEIIIEKAVEPIAEIKEEIKPIRQNKYNRKSTKK